MRNLNLFLAVFWLVLGVGLVTWHWLYPEQQGLRIRGTDWSPGWLGIVLGIYNLVRWQSVRASQRQREVLEEQRRMARERERDQRREAIAPDPTFDFTKPSAEEKGDM